MKRCKIQKILFQSFQLYDHGALIMWVAGFDVVKGYSALLKGSLENHSYRLENITSGYTFNSVALDLRLCYAGFFNISRWSS